MNSPSVSLEDHGRDEDVDDQHLSTLQDDYKAMLPS